MPRPAFLLENPVPEAWSRRLADLGGTGSDRVHWPFLAWIPGEPWCPVQRWGIFEMIPASILRRDDMAQARDGGRGLVMEDLEGPHPRARWHYDSTLGRMTPGQDAHGLVTLQEWQIFRETGCWARLTWVIQGVWGGHKRRLSQGEILTLRAFGRNGDVPAPGDLPYAPFDERVMAMLAEHDRVKEEYDKYRVAKLTMKGLRHRRREAEVRFRERLLKWLDHQIEANVDEYATKAVYDELADAPLAPEMAPGDMDAASHEFTQDTQDAPIPLGD